ncbi:hypothetical protein UFOVP1082_45 [uncultured Caudovirales phage]|uniref:Uncharacterized protein n=1 Tax=uncultured Caudovirales phage TaxID=2100421 RepID=A0A6J5QR39_9CAUD|nr:hypothetical protein UFOVP906_23 [uncultured Caudovirales phage]CAB4176644.1 hypothetical protein UFOVP992_49 [uncultured Caudovirales phage]CAB4183438.1 hypothetical protein UFOVP1082_45 [uncultured Caudovirales phage]CAB4197582.1 hypothetical protein UFOVP1322_30 [uncultured Caudovirales phage]CAB4212936.1 hypothetical protein UFOVP1434_52 [uncultured Caudovirales phage]
MSYGAQIKFGIARQATEGTAVAVATSYHPMPLLSEDVGFEFDELISQNLTGRFDQGASYTGTSRVNGTIEFEITPRNIGAALASCVNYNPATATSGTVKTYTFLPNTADFSATAVKAPFTVYKQFADATSAEQFFDVQFGQLEISVAQGQFLKCRLTAAGGARSPNGVGSLAVTPDATDVGRLFPWNVASISYGGSGLSTMSEVTVALNESIQPVYAVNGSLAPLKYSRSGFREVTVNGTFYMNDRAILNNMIAGTQSRLVITLVSTIAAIQSGYYNTLSIDVPQLKITQFKPGVSGPGEVSVSFTGRGVLDPTSSYTVQYTLQNTYGAGY